MMEITELYYVDEYLFIFGFAILILFTIYKAYDIYKFRTGENARYKSFLDEINFQEENKINERESISVRKKNYLNLIND